MIIKEQKEYDGLNLKLHKLEIESEKVDVFDKNGELINYFKDDLFDIVYYIVCVNEIINNINIDYKNHTIEEIKAKSKFELNKCLLRIDGAIDKLHKYKKNLISKIEGSK